MPWWQDIYTLLLHGEVKLVSDLLKNYLDESKGSEYVELYQKIQQLPQMKLDDDRDDFKRRFNAYQKSCKVLLNRFNTTNPDEEHLLVILNILVGDTETLQQVCSIDNFNILERSNMECRTSWKINFQTSNSLKIRSNSHLWRSWCCIQRRSTKFTNS